MCRLVGFDCCPVKWDRSQCLWLHGMEEMALISISSAVLHFALPALLREMCIVSVKAYYEN